MAKNYAMGFAMGNDQYPITNAAAPIKAIVTTTSENATVSSVITLSDNTTAVEIATVGGPALMRWVFVTDANGPATSVIVAAGTANFDHMVASGNFRRFVVPIEIQNNSQGYSSQVGQRVANGLFARLAYKSVGAASVLVTEYGSSNLY